MACSGLITVWYGLIITLNLNGNLKKFFSFIMFIYRPPYTLYCLIASLILMIIIAVVLGVVIPVSLSTNNDNTVQSAYGK